MKYKISFSILLVLVTFTISSCGGGSSKQVTFINNNQVALDNGGSIKFPTGSIAANTDISVTETSKPELPAGLVAVGKSYHVNIDKQPALPAEISLPIPATEDAEKLVIMRIESNGRVSMLESRIENNMLIAKTPGFSTFTIARLKELYNLYRPNIVGPDFIPTNKRVEYREQVTLSKMPGLNANWSAYQYVNGKIKNIELTNQQAIFKNSRVAFSADSPGDVYLNVEIIEPKTGLRAFTSKTISVQETLQSGNNLDITIEGTSSVKALDNFQLQARVLNTDVKTISTWRWLKNGIELKSQSCDSNCLTNLQIFEDKSISSVPGKHTITVEATSDTGITGTASFNIIVLDDEIRIIDIYPQQTQTPSGLIAITVDAVVLGGVPPYFFSWDLQPGNDKQRHFNVGIDTDTYVTSVDQPGGYILSLSVFDSNNSKAQTAYSLLVKPIKTMNISFDIFPTGNIKVNQQITATLKTKGMFLVWDGEKIPGYEYEINWDAQNGNSGNVEKGMISADYPEIGGEISLTHSYKTPGKKVVSIKTYPKGFGYGYIPSLPTQVAINVTDDSSATSSSGPVLNGTLTFYKNASTSPTGDDYTVPIVVNAASEIERFEPDTGCAEIVNNDKTYSSRCVYISGKVQGNEAGNNVRFEFRFSHLLTPGIYDIGIKDANYRGYWVTFNACTDDDIGVRIPCGGTDYSRFGIEQGFKAKVTIYEFSKEPGSHVKGQIDADITTGAGNSGHITADFDFVIPN